jgi:hypothetical protein
MATLSDIFQVLQCCAVAVDVHQSCGPQTSEELSASQNTVNAFPADYKVLNFLWGKLCVSIQLNLYMMLG